MSELQGIERENFERERRIERERADAKLRAAAGDMLEALKAADAWICNTPAITSAMAKEKFRTAELIAAAIKKAEGRE